MGTGGVLFSDVMILTSKEKAFEDFPRSRLAARIGKLSPLKLQYLPICVHWKIETAIAFYIIESVNTQLSRHQKFKQNTI